MQFASIEAGVVGPGIRGCLTPNKRKLPWSLKCQFATSGNHPDTVFCWNMQPPRHRLLQDDATSRKSTDTLDPENGETANPI